MWYYWHENNRIVFPFFLPNCFQQQTAFCFQTETINATLKMRQKKDVRSSCEYFFTQTRVVTATAGVGVEVEVRAEENIGRESVR